MPCGEKFSNYITVFIGEALIRVRRGVAELKDTNFDEFRC